MTVIVSHSYISAKWHLDKGIANTWKSANKVAVNKAIGHLDYIQHRPGADKEKHGRAFFDDKNDDIDGREVRNVVREGGKERNIVAHKLMISPDIDVADLKQMTREVMKELGDDKGLDLNWKAVEHRNTDHPHVHILILAKDLNGREVRLTKQDHDKIEKNADRILDRDYPWQRRQVQLEREEKQRQIQKQELEQAKENFRFYELPWMKQQVIREQYEPHADWKKDVDLKRQQRREFQSKPILIAEQEYSKDNSLEELQKAQKILHRRGGERLPAQEYKKLRSWISDRQLEAETGQKAHPDPGKFEYQGKPFTKDSPLEELRAFKRFLRDSQQDPEPSNHKRLPSEDFEKLRQWIDDKHREQGAGSVDDAVKKAITMQAREEKQYADSAAIMQEAQGGKGNSILSLFIGVGLESPPDDQSRASKRVRESTVDRREMVSRTLKASELADHKLSGTNSEVAEKIKSLRLANENISRNLQGHDKQEKRRKRDIERQRDEMDFDDADFPGEF